MGMTASEGTKMSFRIRRLLHTVFLLACVSSSVAGCFGILDLGISEQSPPASYQVSLSRLKGSRVEFEQYRGVPGGVFVECGAVVQGRPQPQEQGISAVSRDQEELVTEKALEFVEQGGDGAVFAFEPPSEFDQAIVSLKVDARVVEVRTSIESLGRAETESAVALKELLEAIRSLPQQAPCRNDSFATIARTEPS